MKLFEGYRNQFTFVGRSDIDRPGSMYRSQGAVPDCTIALWSHHCSAVTKFVHRNLGRHQIQNISAQA